jgi:hypothetical protein
MAGFLARMYALINMSYTAFEFKSDTWQSPHECVPVNLHVGRNIHMKGRQANGQRRY